MAGANPELLGDAGRGMGRVDLPDRLARPGPRRLGSANRCVLRYLSRFAVFICILCCIYRVLLYLSVRFAVLSVFIFDSTGRGVGRVDIPDRLAHPGPRRLR